MTRSVYVIHPTTGTVHLAADDFADKTRCGQPIVSGAWSWGDETASGLVATCARCLALHKRKGQ